MSGQRLRILLTHKIAAIGGIGLLGVALVGGIYFIETHTQSKYMLAADQSSRLRHFRRYCELLDERRGENTAAVFPEVASLLS